MYINEVIAAGGVPILSEKYAGYRGGGEGGYFPIYTIRLIYNIDKVSNNHYSKVNYEFFPLSCFKDLRAYEGLYCM